MRFLIDAQLPRRLAHRLRDLGFDTIHTLDLPLGNRTSDNGLLELSGREDRVIVTKDRDFVHSFIVAGRPRRLLLISTGNASNQELEMLLRSHLELIVTGFETSSYLELTRESLIAH